MRVVREIYHNTYRVEFGKRDGELYWKIVDAKRGVILEQGTPKTEFEMLYQIIDTLETLDIFGIDPLA